MMAATVKELREWLADLNDRDEVGIDDGGLTLVVEGKENYYEIGVLQSEDLRRSQEYLGTNEEESKS